MTWANFVDQSFVAFLGFSLALAAWFCRAIVFELREMKKSISEMNVTLAVVINNQSHHANQIDDIKTRVVRLETERM